MARHWPFAKPQHNATRPHAKAAPMLLPLRSSTTFILITICIAVFTDIFLYDVIVPVIPFALRNRVGVHEDDVQHWVSVLLAAYGAALLACSPIAGYAADRLPNRRLPLLFGLLVLAAATLLLCFGASLPLLLVARLLQGASAAIVWTVGLALLADTVERDSIGQASGYVSISMSLAILVAPVLGGVVYAKAGYYSVYYMAFGMIILDILLRIFLIEKKVAQQWIKPDAPIPLHPFEEHQDQQQQPDRSNSVDAIHPVTAPTNPTIHQQPSPNVSPQQTEHDHDPSPNTFKAMLLLLSSRRLIAALICTLVDATLLTAFDAVLPIYVNKLFGWSSIGAGLIFLPAILPSFLAPVVGYWADKRGPRWPVTLGFLCAVPPLVLLRLVDHNSIRQIVLLCALLALFGSAVANGMVPLLAEITHVLGHKEQTHPGAFGGQGAYATAYGLFNMAFSGGMLVGPLWGGLVVQRAGWGTMGWSLGLLSFLTAGLAWSFIGGAVWQRRKRQRDVEGRGS